MKKYVFSHNFPALDEVINFLIHHVYDPFFSFFEAERAFVERVFAEKIVKLVNRQPLAVYIFGTKTDFASFSSRN